MFWLHHNNQRSEAKPSRGEQSCHYTKRTPSHQGRDEYLDFNISPATNPTDRKRLLCFTAVTTAEPWSLILTNDSPSNLTNYICTAVNEAWPLQKRMSIHAPTIKGKGQLQLRVQGLSIIVWPFGSMRRDTHERLIKMLHVSWQRLNPPGFRVFLPCPLTVLIQYAWPPAAEILLG